MFALVHISYRYHTNFLAYSSIASDIPHTVLLLLIFLMAERAAFFYGTLMHPKILKAVIQNDGAHLKVCPAVLLVSNYDYTDRR